MDKNKIFFIVTLFYVFIIYNSIFPTKVLLPRIRRISYVPLKKRDMPPLGTKTRWRHKNVH